LPALLEDIPLREHEELIFQHDGAPAQFSRQARDILNARYPGKWMGRGPIHSPNLNMLDCFVWDHVKDLIEHMHDSNEDVIREAILAAFNAITSEMAHRATRNIARRADCCLRERGWHFEKFLY